MTRRYAHITAAELTRWADMRAGGRSYNSISREVGRHHETVRRALRMYDRDSHVDERHEEAEYLRLMRQALVLRNQQWTYRDIAERIGWHATTNSLRNGLRRYARRNGWPLYQRAS